MTGKITAGAGIQNVLLRGVGQCIEVANDGVRFRTVGRMRLRGLQQVIDPAIISCTAKSLNGENCALPWFACGIRKGARCAAGERRQEFPLLDERARQLRFCATADDIARRQPALYIDHPEIGRTDRYR
ncbi:MAG TPA: hypothetical protein VF924_05760 [Stellaceae bacterium]